MLNAKKIMLIAAGTVLSVGVASAADKRTAHGVIVAKETAVLSSELAAPIAKMPVLVGSTFKKGDLLVKFDCGLYEARLDGLKASFGKNAAKLKRAQNLYARKAAGIAEVNDARADVAYSRSEIAVLKKQMQSCEIKAPYSGRVVEKTVNTFEQPQANAPLLSIVGDNNLEIDLVVPSRWLRWLRIGEPFSLKVTETGKVLKGTIERVGASVNSVSQTIRVYGHIEGVTHDVIPGMGGVVEFESRTNVADAG